MQHQPQVYIDERGDLVLEWFAGEKTLTFYIAPSKDLTYLKTWQDKKLDRTNFEDGEVEYASHLVKLLGWLDK